MRFLTTRVHGMTDYLVAGIIFIISPFVFGFADGSVAQWVPIILGIALLASSLCTKYELGFVPLIPMQCT